MGHLYAAVVRCRSEAHRPGTRRNFRTYRTVFIQFCLNTHIDVYNPTIDDLAVFAKWFIEAELAPATVRNYLSAVKMLYLTWDLAPAIEVFSSYSWALTLKGIQLSVRPPPDSQTAVTFEHPEALVAACEYDVALWP